MTTIKLECYDCGEDLKLEHNEYSNAIRVHRCPCTDDDIKVVGSTILVGESDG